jgi:acetylornithine/succinyldiaminopimelate/putrescine aminotransferase
MDKEDPCVTRTYHPQPVALDKANGDHFWDIEGKQHCDSLRTYGVRNQGLCHPRMVVSIHAGQLGSTFGSTPSVAPWRLPLLRERATPQKARDTALTISK